MEGLYWPCCVQPPTKRSKTIIETETVVRLHNTLYCYVYAAEKAIPL